MTLPTPLHYLDTLMAKDINLDTFSGFIYATVIVPEGVIPVLHQHIIYSNRLTYPSGIKLHYQRI